MGKGHGGIYLRRFPKSVWQSDRRQPKVLRAKPSNGMHSRGGLLHVVMRVQKRTDVDRQEPTKGRPVAGSLSANMRETRRRCDLFPERLRYLGRE
jgi:hypothetical protein